MKAAIWYGGNNIKIEERPKPTITDNEVLIRVRAAGLCGTELHAFEGISERRKPPLLMGHEFSGEVAELGKQVRNLKIGERVSIDPLTRCGVCEQCTSGRGNICRNVRLIGLHTNGAFAEYVPAPATNCHKLPDHVSFEEGSVVEPLSVAVHSVLRTPIKVGDVVVVLGAGPIGLMLLQAARAAGARETIVTDVVDYRLDSAKALGADMVINSKSKDPVKAVMELTENKGVDVALEAVGIQPTVQQAMAMVKIGGRVAVTGMLAKTMQLEMLDAVVKEMDIKGTYGYTQGDFGTALGMIIKGSANVKPMITHVLPLSDIVKGFELLHKKAEGCVKVVVKP